MKKAVAKLSREAHASLKKQHEAFKEKFGREPGSDDPLFFDPDYDVPTPLADSKLRRELTKAVRKAGLDVERILNAFGFEDEEGGTKDF